MIVPAGVKVHLALGYTDMKGMDGLAMLVQDTLKKDAFSGHLFAFRGKRARIMKILFWDGRPWRRWHSRWHASALPCRARAAQSIGSPSKASRGFRVRVRASGARAFNYRLCGRE